MKKGLKLRVHEALVAVRPLTRPHARTLTLLSRQRVGTTSIMSLERELKIQDREIYIIYVYIHGVITKKACRDTRPWRLARHFFFVIHESNTRECEVARNTLSEETLRKTGNTRP
jgi:hypothetical protein